MQFILTEKPSVAVAIAAVLNVKERNDGFFIGNNYIISWCVGHLIELATANNYGRKINIILSNRKFFQKS